MWMSRPISRRWSWKPMLCLPIVMARERSPRLMYIFHGHWCWVQPLSFADFHVYLCSGHGKFPLIWDCKSFWVAYEVKVMFCNIYANTNVLDASLCISYFEPSLLLNEKKRSMDFESELSRTKTSVLPKEGFFSFTFCIISPFYKGSLNLIPFNLNGNVSLCTSYNPTRYNNYRSRGVTFYLFVRTFHSC